MAHGVAALGITIPKRAPAMAIKDGHDGALSTLSKRLACGSAPFLDKTLNRTDLAVYALFAAHTDPAGFTFVGQERIALLLQCSQQLVSKSYSKLVKRGYIKRSRKPAANGHAQNVTRILIDSSVTDADARSISNAPQHNHYRQKVVIGQSPLIGHLSTRTTLHRNTITTRINGHQLPLPDGSRKGELIKPLAHKLESAEQAISLWLTYAWKHGKHQPIADDDDLATAHKLVAGSITSEELERAIIQDPEADSLKPVVRHLLP